MGAKTRARALRQEVHQGARRNPLLLATVRKRKAPPGVGGRFLGPGPWGQKEAGEPTFTQWLVIRRCGTSAVCGELGPGRGRGSPRLSFPSTLFKL